MPPSPARAPALLALLAAALLPLRSSGASDLLLFADPGAVCLDGSPGGLYLKRGSGADADRWVFWFLGGGWSFSPEDAAARAAGRLGSSKYWAPTATFGGILNEDAEVNPDFATWSTAVFCYCDGSSYTSDWFDCARLGSPPRRSSPGQRQSGYGFSSGVVPK